MIVKIDKKTFVISFVIAVVILAILSVLVFNHFSLYVGIRQSKSQTVQPQTQPIDEYDAEIQRVYWNGYLDGFEFANTASKDQKVIEKLEQIP